MGIAGAWIGGLEALGAYKWLFLVATSAFLGYGFYAVYWRRARCSGQTVACSVSRGDRAVRRWLWIATFLAITGIIFEQVQRLLR
jgi:mercuric ion transport protein